MLSSRFALSALAVSVLLVGLMAGERSPAPRPGLEVGFGEADVTPSVAVGKVVYLAGFGQNRRATGVHDPLRARAVVLCDGQRKLAFVSVDVVGLFLATAERVRARLKGFDYVAVSSTHNHEGPDTLGLWGANPFQKGTDPKYLDQVEQQIMAAVRSADQSRRQVTARIGSCRAPELLHDGREPWLKHDELVALVFHDVHTGKEVGLVVQWNCHPETLDSRNTLISSDFVGATVEAVQKKHPCPVVYLTGTVGGLMTSLKVPIHSPDGRLLQDGTFEKTQRYGECLAVVVEKAVRGSQPVRLIPLVARVRRIALPMDNKLYLLARQLGVLDRPAFEWKGKLNEFIPAKTIGVGRAFAIQTEVGYVRLGELEVAVIPGEIYPELVLGRVQDPVDLGADFPDAPKEPGLYEQMKCRHRMVIGLGNDELGYIIPKRQWDEKPPFCYGRAKAQYGERNSLGPETAPLICRAFKELVEGKE